MHYPTKTIAIKAGEIIESRRIIYIEDDSVKMAKNAAKAFIGVSGETSTEEGKACDTITEGIAKVEYGATVTETDPLTSDAQGRAIPATTTGQNIIGFAVMSGALGDEGAVDIQKSTLAAPASTPAA